MLVIIITIIAFIPLLLAVSLMGIVWFGSYWLVGTLERREYITHHPLLHPNTISYIRIPLGIIGTIFIALNMPTTALLIFAFAITTDATDGIIARACRLETDRGKWLDPFADKAVYFPPLIFFMVVGGHINGILISLLLVFDLGSQLVRPLLTRLRLETAANNFGKLKAIAIFVLILILIEYDRLGMVMPIDTIVASMVTVATILAACSLLFKFIPKKQYANILSTLNLIAGLIAIMLIMKGFPIHATLAMLAGQLFDLFDGRMARLYGGTRIGPWLDDIADGLSFGIVPAIFFMNVYSDYPAAVLIGIGYGLAVFYRLVRFILVDKKNNNLPSGVFS